MFWPGLGEVPASELVLRRLLPLAHEGLERLGARRRATATGCSGSSSSAALTQRNGATWQAETFHKLYDDQGLEREQALREMTVRYRDLMHANEPVHGWPVG